jgi:hypothetical protein
MNRLPFIGIVALLLMIVPAAADVVVAIDKSAQHMTVSVDGATRWTWPVSTGARGYDTPKAVIPPSNGKGLFLKGVGRCAYAEFYFLYPKRPRNSRQLRQAAGKTGFARLCSIEPG